MASERRRRLRRAETTPHDVTASREGFALQRLESTRPRRAGSHITSTIPWAPKKPSGTGAWLALSVNRQSRGRMVRGRSNSTPKLQASYVRAFRAD